MDTTAAGQPGGHALGLKALELWVGSAFAIAQPLLSLLGSNATYFTAHQMLGTDLVAFAVVLLFVVPAVLVAFVLAVSLIAPKAGDVVHGATMGILFAATIGPPLARTTGSSTIVWLILFTILTIIGFLLVTRVNQVRTALHVLAFAPFLFLAYFLFMSQASELVKGAGQAQARQVTDVDTAPVVWLILDQFPLSNIIDSNGHIIKERYPNLARLADTSTWYPDATAGTVRTEYSVPAALSGRWPKRGDLPVASQLPDNVFTYLASDNYQIHAEEYVTQMCPDAICQPSDRVDSTWSDSAIVYVRYLLPETLADRWAPRIDGRWDGFQESSRRAGVLVSGEATDESQLRAVRRKADENSVRFERFLSPIKAGNLTGMHYAHLFLPHEPFRYLPDGRIMELPHLLQPDADGRWPDSEPAMRSRLQKAISQTIYADLLVGELLDSLESSGDLDRTALVVMSDHGASTRPGVLNRSATDPDSILDTVPLMLFVKVPHQSSGELDERRVQQVDILPTLLDVLELQPTELDGRTRARFDGISFFGAPTPEWSNRIPQRLTKEGLQDFVKPGPPSATSSPTIGWIKETFLDPADPFRVRPTGHLLGTPVVAGSLNKARFTATLDQPSAFDSVSLQGAPLPANVTGTLEDAPLGVVIGVVVNGTLAGSAESFETDRHRFSVLVDPDWFVEGPNKVELVTAPIGKNPGSMDSPSWEHLMLSPEG